MNPEEMIARLSAHTSPARRIANTVAMLGGATAAAVVGLLWATEPGLPPLTRAAFAAIVVVGLAWTGYGAWALTRRTPLFARDRVIAAWLALVATGLLALTVVLVTALGQRVTPVVFVLVTVLLGLALVNLGRARAHRAALLRRRRELGGQGDYGG